MVTIRTTTQIDAPLERCFRLSLSVDLEKNATGRQAIDGVTRGLIGPGETITWSEDGLNLHLHQTLIDIWRPFSYFRDVMVEGPFGAFEHDHHFAVMDDGTRIRDEVRFTARPGIFSHATESLFLRRRVLNLLRLRNIMLKQVAESEEWHRYLDDQPEVDQHIYQAFSASTPTDKHAFAR